MALPKPSKILPIIPLCAAGMITRKIHSIFVEPKAKAASLMDLGTLERASSLILAIMGTIISPKISEAVNIFSPVSKFNQFLISGAIADIPKSP